MCALFSQLGWIQFCQKVIYSMIVAFYRRQMVENLKKMQELKAQIQAQMKLAETLKKLSENAGTTVHKR